MQKDVDVSASVAEVLSVAQDKRLIPLKLSCEQYTALVLTAILFFGNRWLY